MRYHQGMTTLRFFLDTEFNDEVGDCRIEPISIGLVSEDGQHEFYAVSSEFSESAAHPWLRENVLPKLPPMHQRVPLLAMRDGVRGYFNGFSKPGVTDMKLQIWGKNIGCDMVVMGLLFGGLSKFYGAMTEIGVRRSFFNDTDTLRTRLSEQGITSPRMDIPESQRHQALRDAHQERQEYLLLKNLLS